jgi:predicted O-methyltransferase YrrM
MMSKIWDKVDDYYAKAFGASDPVLTKVLAASKKAGLPDIQVSPLQGRLLMLLAQSMGANASSKWAPWAATAASGWRARCPLMAG